MAQFLPDRKLEEQFPTQGISTQSKRIRGLKGISGTRNEKSRGQITRGRPGREIQVQNDGGRDAEEKQMEIKPGQQGKSRWDCKVIAQSKKFPNPFQ